MLRPAHLSASTLALSLLALGPGAPPAWPQQELLTTVLVVRHAERASQDANADLSAAGRERALELAEVARAYGVQAVYTTEYCRTAETGEPAALALGLPLLVQPGTRPGIDLESCEPPLQATRWRLEEFPDLPALVELMRSEQRGRTVLVVGHSNTVPEWVVALGAPAPCPELLPFDAEGRCWLPDEDHHHLFVVTLYPDGRVSARLESYGRAP